MKKIRRKASIRDMVAAMQALDMDSIPPQKRQVAVMAQYLKVATQDMDPVERGRIFAGFAKKVAESNSSPSFSDLITRGVATDGPKSEQEAAFLDILTRKLD